MAFWDKFKKRPSQQDIPVLAGIPVEDSYQEAGIAGPDPDKDNSFISPPPHNNIIADWVMTYPLVFYLMENNVCTRKIDFVCYAGQKPDDILFRMMMENILPEKPGIAYRILYWPTRNGKSTVDQLDDSEPLLVQDFNPKPGSVFIIEQYRKVEQSEPLYTLYGCPTAAMPEQQSLLQNRCVDVLSWD